jgi:ureidoacrylate peracid hydrolase
VDPEFKHLISPKHSAILIIDVQNDPCHPEGLYAQLGRDIRLRQKAAENTAAFIARARKYGVSLIFIKLNHNDWNESPAWKRRNRRLGAWTMAYKEGTWGEQFYLVDPKDGDAVITKHRYSAFVGTELDVVLRNRQITTLIITGGGTGACVESTVRHGLCLDYDIVVAPDCCGATKVDDHSIALKRMANLGALMVESHDIIEAWITLGAQPC